MKNNSSKLSNKFAVRCANDLKDKSIKEIEQFFDNLIDSILREMLKR